MWPGGSTDACVVAAVSNPVFSFGRSVLSNRVVGESWLIPAIACRGILEIICAPTGIYGNTVGESTACGAVCGTATDTGVGVIEEAWEGAGMGLFMVTGAGTIAGPGRAVITGTAVTTLSTGNGTVSLIVGFSSTTVGIDSGIVAG